MGDDIKRFNQLLLLDAYPFELAKTNDIYSVVQFDAPEQTFMLPDEKRDYFLTTARAPFVTQTTKVALVNGMVQSLQEVRPSLVLGALSIPKTIVGAIAPLPLQMQQSQQNIMESRSKTLDA